ncbi:hypothetical protein HIM_02698 [Hirsutella minnesotensis 3608]|nr:hypothetical protein HIM_02698 [Hirsutella minnesotensis 3608]
MRKPQRLYSLARPKLRQSWNKYNLYNIARKAGVEPQIRGRPTFFQQKWAAKSKTRAYHGEHVPEKKWVRMFSPRLLSAVDMPPEYLAAHDGSEQATGRGSGTTNVSISADAYSKAPMPSSTTRRPDRNRGADTNHLLSKNLDKMTPYMQMTYAPLERRLDTAVFRAMFASSIRQARQFVIHGAVKVNGKKMTHPSYMLNPGDMFQVEIDKVLFGTGEQKKPNEFKRLHENLEARKKKAATLFPGAAAESEAAAEEGSESAEAGASDDSMVGSGMLPASEAESMNSEAAWKANNKALKFILKTVRSILDSNQKELRAKEKKMLRLFRTDIRRFLSRPEDSKVDAQELLKDLQVLMKNHELMRSRFEKNEQHAPTSKTEETEGAEETASQFNRKQEIDSALQDLTEEQQEKAKRIMGSSILTREEMRKLGWLLQKDEENPIDDSKPYATPWRPRAFMSAFAFIPRYLEVNPNICAAVYLRHPLARKGMAEVPTPFSYLTNQLAHGWYLQRG